MKPQRTSLAAPASETPPPIAPPVVALAFAIALVTTCAVALVASGCHSMREPPGYRPEMGVGDWHRGKDIIEQKGCGACHQIPGVHAARGEVGPPLTDLGKRSLIAGELPNTPDNLVRWLLDPPGIEPHTAMPNLDLDERDARDVAAFLLRED